MDKRYNKANKDLKEFAYNKNVYLYEIAHELGYKSPTYSTMLFRNELSNEQKENYKQVVIRISDRKREVESYE